MPPPQPGGRGQRGKTFLGYDSSFTEYGDIIFTGMGGLSEEARLQVNSTSLRSAAGAAAAPPPPAIEQKAATSAAWA